MSDTPRVDELIERHTDATERLRINGCLTMDHDKKQVLELVGLARQLERELGGANSQLRSINQALNEGDGTYRP